jgi:hypothetical protein
MEDRVEPGELVRVVQLGQEHAVQMVRRLLTAVEPDLGVVADTCRFLMSRDATRRNAITMTPACMDRSGIHFTRERFGSKKAQGPWPRRRRTEFIPFLPRRSICSLKRNQRNGKTE